MIVRRTWVRVVPLGALLSSAGCGLIDAAQLARSRVISNCGISGEDLDAALDFIERANKSKEPFFLWWSGTRMHFRTHVKAENRGKSGQNEYADGMLEHDGHIGQFLAKLDELGIADNTIVFYSTDNGPSSLRPLSPFASWSRTPVR